MLHGGHASLVVVALVVVARFLLQRGLTAGPRRRERRSDREEG